MPWSVTTSGRLTLRVAASSPSALRAPMACTIRVGDWYAFRTVSRTANASHPPPSKDRRRFSYTPKVSSAIRTLSRALTARPPQPPGQAVRLHDLERAIPTCRVVAGEIKVQGGDLGLDRPPERPADVRHQREEVHPGKLPSVRPAEVGLAQNGSQLVIETRLLRRVAQVEARIVVTTQLVINDPQGVPVVDEVLAQQVVVTGHARERPNPDRFFDVGH